jgi:hypothetical protein
LADGKYGSAPQGLRGIGAVRQNVMKISLLEPHRTQQPIFIEPVTTATMSRHDPVHSSQHDRAPAYLGGEHGP